MLRKEILVEKSKKLAVLLQDYGFSYADSMKILRNKDVRVNGKPTKENLLLNVGDTVIVFYPETMLQKRYEKIFEDDDVIIIYKFSNIEIEGERGLESVLGAIAVHRLDRNTEGLMVFAKNPVSAEKLKLAFKNRLVHKFYVAEVVGEFNTNEKVFRAFLKKDSERATVAVYQEAVKGGVEILTKIKTVRSDKESSLLKIELLTGKTHQIRAHLAFLGHAIIGDGKYGKGYLNKKFKQNKQKLACFMLKFEKIGIKSLDNQIFQKFPSWLKDVKNI